MAYNDTLLVHRLFISRRNEAHEDIYFFRIASSQLFELGTTHTLLAAGYDDWPEVRAFVAGLSPERQADFLRLRELRVASGSLGERLQGFRNQVFHYPHLHARAALRGRLELASILQEMEDDEGELRIERRVRGTRSLFADEVVTRILTKHAGGTPGLRDFIVDVRDAQLALMRFAEAALDAYFGSLPAGTVMRA